jgi:hypothetical protein
MGYAIKRQIRDNLKERLCDGSILLLIAAAFVILAAG